MRNLDATIHSYEERLAAVEAARRTAEAGNQQRDADALRLAEAVLRDLIAERATLQLVETSAGPETKALT